MASAAASMLGTCAELAYFGVPLPCRWRWRRLSLVRRLAVGGVQRAE